MQHDAAALRPRGPAHAIRGAPVNVSSWFRKLASVSSASRTLGDRVAHAATRLLTRHSARVAKAARFEPAAYVLWAAAVTLLSARSFYGYMLKQTGGEWSAPLDDVFIHFDYARATAEGHPFHWVSGNGYSSGNTSLLYPFVLAGGYLAGFRGEALMKWAAIVASVCVFGTLLVARRWVLRAFDVKDAPIARLGSYLLPPALLGIGALVWSLWSGMEVALFLATWSLALLASFEARDACEPAHAPEASAPANEGIPSARSDARKRALWLGLACALMVVTRPEAITTTAAFAVALAWAAWSRSSRVGRTRLIESLALPAIVAAPGAIAVVLQSVANRLLTGEWSANGAIVKLALNHPYMTADEKLADYLFNLKYAVLRNVEYHFADIAAFGLIVPGLAAVPLLFRATRGPALLLWAQIAGWLLMVSLNGQVRWQNERYTQPAVAWLVLLAVLGATVLLFLRRERPQWLLTALIGAAAAQGVALALRPPGSNPTLQLAWLSAIAIGVAVALVLRLWPARAAFAVAAVALFVTHQEPKMRDQKWFFGRASRNIRDQHLRAGRFLAKLEPKRILVGDAGALLYASGRPGLDIIGLGGYHDLPFARAGVHGLGATIELIERMPAEERPDVFAIYPTWWGVLPTWFSRREIARFPVEGNVICGGYEKVIYEADWHLLGSGEAPRAIEPGEAVVDVLDVGDLVSERAHGYRFPRPQGGWTSMKILEDPLHRDRDMLDTGRRIAASRSESFTLRGFAPNTPATLVFRTDAEASTRANVTVDGRAVGTLEVVRGSRWAELRLPVPASLVTREALDVVVTTEGPADFVDYHVFALQPARPGLEPSAERPAASSTSTRVR